MGSSAPMRPSVLAFWARWRPPRRPPPTPTATAPTARRLRRPIEESEGPVDAVFCGKQTVDGETGVLGAVLSDMLGYPLLTGCLEAVYAVMHGYVEADRI